MKVGIITQPLRNNYGGLLQNYALQQVLKKMGHEAITLDQRDTPISHIRFIASILKTFIFKMVGRGNDRAYPIDIINKKEIAYTRTNTRYFVDTYITNTPAMYKTAEFRSFCIKNKIDALIAGSDQVWRPCYNENIYRSFFDFAKGLDIKRYAYAASFGVDCWEFTEEQTQKCKELIKLFDTISVREESGIDLCKTYFNRKAEHVLDPTMLLEKEDYEALVYKENEPMSSGNLFTYILDESEEKSNIIEKIAESLNLDPFKVMPKHRVNKQTIKQIDDCVYPPVTRWLRAFMDAEMVVVDSFHGCVFSIIFNKPFWVIGNKERGLARFESLLSLYGLQERLINSDCMPKDINAPIDWSNVNAIKKELQEKSMNFLKNQLVRL